nr:MAG TPA: Baseplate structural protein [Caudoviricetes sp.]
MPVTVSCTGAGTEVLNIPSYEVSKNNSTDTGSNVFISFGLNKSHNNLPSCVAAYIWHRTA